MEIYGKPGENLFFPEMPRGMSRYEAYGLILHYNYRAFGINIYPEFGELMRAT
jgi:hypothetical protein